MGSHVQAACRTGWVEGLGGRRVGTHDGVVVLAGEGGTEAPFAIVVDRVKADLS